VLSPIVAEIYGPDYDGQVAVAKRVRAAFEDTPDIVGVDDTVDEDEAMLSGAMPIIAMARLMQPSTGNPMTDPNQQGGEGAANTPGGPQADAQGQGQTGVGAVRQGLDVSAGPPGMM